MTLPPSPVEVRGDGVLLRGGTEADVPRLLEAFADERIRFWNPGPEDEAGVRELVAKRTDWTTGDHASWLVADPHTGDLLGSVSLHHLDLDQGDSEVGYWTAPWARGRGVAAAAVRAAAAYGFTEVGLHRVYLYHALENPASCGVARGAGFLLEGTLRQSYRYADGVRRDEHLHARLASD